MVLPAVEQVARRRLADVTDVRLVVSARFLRLFRRDAAAAPLTVEGRRGFRPSHGSVKALTRGPLSPPLEETWLAAFRAEIPRASVPIRVTGTGLDVALSVADDPVDELPPPPVDRTKGGFVADERRPSEIGERAQILPPLVGGRLVLDGDPKADEGKPVRYAPIAAIWARERPPTASSAQAQVLNPLSIEEEELKSVKYPRIRRDRLVNAMNVWWGHGAAVANTRSSHLSGTAGWKRSPIEATKNVVGARVRSGSARACQGNRIWEK